MPDDLKVTLGLDASGFLNGVYSVDRSVKSLSETLLDMSRGVQREIEAGLNIFTRLDVAQINAEQSARRVTDAQERYTAAIAKFGAGSQQAIAAERDLTTARENQTKASDRAHLANVLVAGDVLAIAVRAPQAVAGLQGLAAAAFTSARGLTAVQVAGGAALAVLTGLAAAGAAFSEEVERGTTAAEELELARKNLEQHAKPVSSGLIGDAFREVAGFLTGPAKTSVEEYESALKRFNEAQKQVDLERVGQGLFDQASAAADAARNLLDVQNATAALEAQNNDLVNSLNTGFSGMGVSLRDFSRAAQDDLMRAAGVTEEFIAKTRPLVDVEAMLKNAAGEAGAALRAQTDITAKKDETTEAFIARLKELGFTEEEIAFRVDETGRRLRSQADATDAAANSIKRLNGIEEARAKSGSGGGAATRGKTASSSGWSLGAPVERVPTLAEFIEDNARSILSSFLGTTSNTALNSMLFDPEGVAAHLMSGDSGIGVEGVGAYVGGGAGSPQFARFVQALKENIVRSLPSNQWDALLGQLGVNGFAHGVSGVITKPGLFYAGEHGRESIQIRPTAIGDERGGGESRTVVIQPGAIVVHGRHADDLMRQLRRLGVNALS